MTKINLDLIFKWVVYAAIALSLAFWTTSLGSQAHAFAIKGPAEITSVPGKLTVQSEGEPAEYCYTTQGVVNWLKSVDPAIRVSYMVKQNNVGLLAVFSDGSGVIFLGADDDGLFCSATYINNPLALFQSLNEAVQKKELKIVLIWPQPKDL